MHNRRNALGLALPASLMLLVLFVAPIAFIFGKSLGANGFDNYIKFFSDSYYRGILWNTIWTACKVTFFALLLGYPTAYYIARTKSRWKNLMMIATVFPFLVSALVRAYGWTVILGDNGLLNQFLLGFGFIEQPLKILYTLNGVTIGLVHLLVPYMILSIASVIQNINPNVEAAAESLGANRWQTLRRVILPLSLPGVITGCILVFTLSMTAYVTPKLLGGPRVKMMSTMVQQEVNVTFNWDMAAVLSFILLLTILAILLVANFSTQRAMDRLGGGKA